ncbi:cytochrome P450 [Russula compacta]|nr:cytochrome P450 [Russula compacta]
MSGAHGAGFLPVQAVFPFSEMRFNSKIKAGCSGKIASRSLSVIVLNSLKAASELLHQRANIYSDRPPLVVANDILCGGLFTTFMSHGNVWRRTRRAAHEMLTKVVVRDYRPVFCKEAILLASAILEDPDALEKHIQRTSASAAMSILYNHPTLENEDDKTLVEIHAFIDRLSMAARGPTIQCDGTLDLLNGNHSAMFNGLLDTVCSDIAKGNERPSVGGSLIKNSDRSGLSKHEIAWLLGTLYSAGSETTATTLSWWVLAMITHPEIQKRAQDELDAVVGRFRVPMFADAPSLPYIQALVKESLRWRPALPLGIPHRATEDDWYEGMFIPKGTICVVNLWQCHHDSASYGNDAPIFNPERFLDAHGAHNDGHGTYGFGRRACVGKHAANDSLFIYMATILWAAHLERPLDKSGKEVPLDIETPVDAGMVFRPLPYACKVTPRFPEASSLLMEEIELLKAPGKAGS